LALLSHEGFFEFTLKRPHDTDVLQRIESVFYGKNYAFGFTDTDKLVMVLGHSLSAPLFFKNIEHSVSHWI
jgi:hypothetical protein